MTSSSSTEQPRVRVGRLGRPHGLQGFLGVYVEAGDEVHLQPGSRLLAGDVEVVVKALRRVDRGYQVVFEGFEDRDRAEELRGATLTAAQRRALEEGEYWPEDLIGLEARATDGSRLGVVTGVVAGVAQDRLVIDREGASFEIPFVDDLVPLVDVATGYVEVVVLPGLIEP